VCSIDEAALRRVAEAIDRLDAERKSADPAQLAARIAAIWAMVAEIDPQLTRLASRYATPPGPCPPTGPSRRLTGGGQADTET
jgi:hypothetical protein